MSDFFAALGLWGNISAFIAASVLILIAGTKLESWASKIGRKTKRGEIFAGTFLLAIATSLPDVTTSVTAAWRNHPQLAVNNLLGGVVIQTIVLAIADGVGSKKAMTGTAPSFSLIIQGLGLIFVLTTVGFVAVLENYWQLEGRKADLGPAFIALVYGLMVYIGLSRQGHEPWQPVSSDEATVAPEKEPIANKDKELQGDEKSLARLLSLFSCGALVVFFAGWTLVLTIEQITAITGASEGFLGFTVVAFATSLPELSTTLTAARRGRNLTAVSNIFGSNGFNTALLFIIAIVASEPIFKGFLHEVIAATSLGIFLTAIYLLGMLERRDKTIIRMGWDSAAVLVIGLMGMWVMYALTR